MKLLIVTGIFPPDIGGPATYVELLARELADRGHIIRILTYSDQGSVPAGEGKYNFPVRRVLRSGPVLSRYLRFFLAACQEAGRADIIYSQGPVSEGLPVMLACILRRKSYVLKIVGDHAWEAFQNRAAGAQKEPEFIDPEDFRKFTPPLRIRVIKAVQRWVARNAGAIITPSQYLKRIVTAWGVDSGKIRVIHNAVERISLPGDRMSARAELGIDGKLIVTVARLVPWKGVATLIRAMPEITASYPDCRLLVIGDGPQKDFLERSVDEQDLRGKVRFAGRLPRTEVWRNILAADVFILNSGYEGLPFVVIEAMQIGTPVLVSDKGGNTEVIKNGTNGLVFPYDDKRAIMQAVRNVLEDRPKADRMAGQARKDSELFSKERMLSSTIDTILASYESAKHQH